ncbi:MAG TPA: MbnH family di-heme enzyme [Polyangia bacterium]|nr:MbnH family di-heme enzyme [Polyangia bacterium]
MQRSRPGLRAPRPTPLLLLLLGLLPLVSLASLGAGCKSDKGYAWNLPNGFPKPKVPEDNPMNPAKVELGRRLFYDVRLSITGQYSCGSCHQQKHAFTDGRAQALGATGQLHPRGSMSLANVAYSTSYGWANPILTSVEKQALIPLFIEHPVELGLAGHENELLARLRDDGRYPGEFAAAFPEDKGKEPITMSHVVRAIGAFERTLISCDSVYDRYTQGHDDGAMSESAKRGEVLFNSERLECFHCHGGFNFTDSTIYEGKAFVEAAYHNNGLYNIDGKGTYPPSNTGVHEVSGNPLDMGRFKAPTLRNIALTAPYMHDGSIATLEEVIDHYAAGGRTIHGGPYAGDGSKNPNKSSFVQGFQLTAEERQDLLAFLRSLTDQTFVNDPKFSDLGL